MSEKNVSEMRADFVKPGDLVRRYQRGWERVIVVSEDNWGQVSFDFESGEKCYYPSTVKVQVRRGA